MGSRDAPWQRWLLGGPLATEAGVSLIVLLVSLAYEPSLSGPATFTHIDDQDNFVNHPLLARVAVEGLSAHTLARLWLPQSVTLGVWEPVATLLKVAITRVCGLGSALPFVRVSVGLHICNCAAAYALACRVLSLLRLRGVSGLPRPLGEDHRPVLLAAVLLGVSPLCAEAVAWASGQPYVLAGSFSLLHLWLHLRRYHPSVAERQRGAWVPSALRVLLAFAAAALCKAAALTVFVVPATIDLLVWMHGPGRRLRLLETPTRPGEPSRRELWEIEEEDEIEDDHHPHELEDEEYEEELTPDALRLRAARRRRWTADSGPGDAVLIEAAEHLLERHWIAMVICVLGVALACYATVGMHGRPLSMLEKVLRACHMMVAYPCCALAPGQSHTSVRLHLPARIEPLSLRFGLPTLFALFALKGCTYAVTWYGELLRRHVHDANKAVAVAAEGALPAVALPPPYAFVTHAVLSLCYFGLLLPTLGLFGWGRSGSHITMVRADRYAYIAGLLLGVPCLAGLLALLAQLLPHVARSDLERRQEAMIALRVRALDLLRSELRALGVEHDELTQRLGSGQSAHLPSEPLYSARGEGAAGAPGEGGTARGEEGVKGGAALLSPPRPPLLRRGSSAEAATIAAIAAAAAADALEQSGTEGTQPGSEGTQPGSEGTQQSRLRRRRLYALALLAAVAALRVRETRQLCQVWASPEKLYTHLVAADPTDAPMLQALASLLIDSTDPANHERAESLLRQSLVAEPNSGAGYNQLGLLLKRAKRNADAEAAYAQAIEVAPREGPAYVNWGNLLLDHNNNNPLTKPLDSQDVLTRAAELLTTGVELLPNNAPALNSLAVALKGLGRLDEARAHYEEAISLRPDSASFQHNLALLFMQQGFDTRKPLPEAQSLRALAKQHFEAALALQPAHVGARQNLASLIARTRPPR